MKHKEEVRPSETTREVRPNRVPIHGGKNILSVEGQEPGFHYCWVNDYNVARFEKGGYEFVVHAVIIGDRRIDAVTGIGAKHSVPVGNGVTAYLMRIPDEFHKQDVDAINTKVDEAEAAMFDNLNSKREGTYGKVEYNHPGKKVI